MAASELLLADRDALPLEAGYWCLRDGGFKPRQALRMYEQADGRPQLNAEWEQIRRACLEEVVVSLVARPAPRQFPVFSADEHCTGAVRLQTVCRINAVRALEKTWQPSRNETPTVR